MQEALLKVVATVNSYLTDYVLIFLLIGVGLFFTIRTKFVQVRCFGEGMKNVFGKLSLKGGSQGGGLSSFQALATAIAAQVGTGNIVGACGAILIGGPGAIFWMWIIAFLGMATIYAEATLAQKTRKVNEDGTVEGGPVYYIKTAFTGNFGKFLAVFFAIATMLALGFMGSMVQSNSIAGTMGKAFNIGESFYWIIGITVAVLAGVVFLGGVNRLASVTEKMVPIMACLYLIGSLIVIFARIQYVPETFGMIFKYAFNANALIGGGIGYALKTAISQGAKRGLFSNEAGMGSTPHAHAQANVKTAHEQGTTAMIGVFIDTFIVLTVTALVVISTLYAGNGPLGNPATYTMEGALAAFPKANLAQMAFGSIFWGETFGSIFVAVCLFFFAFSTILSWNFFGKINFQYLFGKKYTVVYTAIAIGFVFLGSIFSNDLVWELTDFFNYLMVLPNVIALVALGSMVVSALKEGKAAKEAAALSAKVAEESAEE
ncbi:MAG: sodium:alanine symporter family protein [Clostridia bacterium]|nr:sodium:alanine symporter family protein [Clostridia bacterium]MBQ3056277.1 sodium:alanine symporter family protein [Clostridia bacterium]